MNQLNRVWMAATVAVVQGPHPDQGGSKWRSGLQSLHHGKRLLFPCSGDDSDLRPISGATIGSDRVDDGVRQSDESLRRVMYLNCWGQG